MKNKNEIDIKFQDVLNSLKIGREIEFEYDNKLYSITNREGFWYLCCDTDNIELNRICKFCDLDLLEKELSKIYIGNKSIIEIFDNLEYNTENMYIL